MTRGLVLADHVTRPRTWRARWRGLLGTQTLPAGQGLWLTPCRQVHMRGMTYALCTVYHDRQGRVLAAPCLVPGMRGPWMRRAAGVLELPAALQTAVAPGDQLTWTPVSAPPRA